MRIPVTIYFIVGGMPEAATKVRLIWDAEIDFISDYEGVLLPIEVKSADNTKAKSLHLFCNRYHPKLAMKTSLKNVGYFIPLFVLKKRPLFLTATKDGIILLQSSEGYCSNRRKNI